MNYFEYFDLLSNYFRGGLLIVLFFLFNIGYLNLVLNELIGLFLYRLVCGEKLGFVNIFNNRLIGGIFRCLIKMGVEFYGNCLIVDVRN